MAPVPSLRGAGSILSMEYPDLVTEDGAGMNKFDYDHPMYVHCIHEPEAKAVPSVVALGRSFPIAASLNCVAGLKVLADEHYPGPIWSISDRTLDAMREQQADFRVFVEIGTYIGQGALAINDYLNRHDLRCPIVTVDTYAGLFMLDGDPTVAPEGVVRYFDRAVVASVFTRFGLAHAGFPVQATARDFFRKFYYLGHQASHIYLDASHEYLDTYEELRLGWECLAEGGVLAGSDYNWATVRAAVDRFCFERRLRFVVTEGRSDGGTTALHWVIAAKDSAARHDDHLHVNRAVA